MDSKDKNFEDKVGKHPIPHAKGIAKDENRDIKENKGEKNEKKNEK